MDALRQKWELYSKKMGAAAPSFVNLKSNTMKNTLQM